MFGLFQHVTQRFNVNREIIIYKINFYKSASVKIEKALKVEVKACESFFIKRLHPYCIQDYTSFS